MNEYVTQLYLQTTKNKDRTLNVSRVFFRQKRSNIKVENGNITPSIMSLDQDTS